MIERRIKAAKFPAKKSLDSFDFKAIPKLNKMQVLELARCEWIERRENVIALGPSGTGKTHVALGLGLAACQKEMSVSFTTAAALVNELMEARDERRLLRLQEQLASVKLLIICPALWSVSPVEDCDLFHGQSHHARHARQEMGSGGLEVLTKPLGRLFLRP